VDHGSPLFHFTKPAGAQHGPFHGGAAAGKIKDTAGFSNRHSKSLCKDITNIPQVFMECVMPVQSSEVRFLESFYKSAPGVSIFIEWPYNYFHENRDTRCPRRG
jgi:hypothetical protein